MKKYLMSGVAAIAFLAAFTSCSKSTDLYEGPKPEPTPEPTPVQEVKTKAELYEEVFEKEFGKIDPNQNWGFTDQTYVSSGKAGTRAAHKNINQWGTTDCPVIIPANVVHLKDGNYTINDDGLYVEQTATEEGLVTNYFRSLPEGTQNNIQLDWTDYFVYQVHKGTDSYIAKNNGTVIGGNQMDHLVARFGDASVAPGKDNAAWHHLNDFNNGNNTTAVTEGRSYQPNFTVIGAVLMQNSGTKEFAYYNSTDSKYHNDYVIIAGADIDPSLAGYYYVGFDFLANGAGSNQQVDRNWKFDDWIIRISPADFVGSQRIFVEDLITSDMNKIDPSDWDFNDAVFDAFMSGSDAVITLRAAGGTLNLTVGGKEVHQAFGVTQEKMVNTGSGPDIAPVQYHINISSTNAEDIPVIVTTKEGETIQLTAKVGNATQKVAAPIDNHVKWLKERTHIKNGYPTFMEFVGDASKIWYVPAYDDFLYQKWY